MKSDYRPRVGTFQYKAAKDSPENLRYL